MRLWLVRCDEETWMDVVGSESVVAVTAGGSASL
jgi:hypothetical protein